jgi:hypothetical protein
MSIAPRTAASISGADGGFTSAGIIRLVSLYVLLVFAIIKKISRWNREVKVT